MLKRILIAEDNKFTSMQYVKLLETKDHTVTVAVDGAQCLEKYSQSLKDESDSGYDVLILDHSMPKKSGAEVAADILSLNPDQKIILASAYALSTEKHYSKLKDKVLFLQKPFQLTRILELVDNEPSEITV